MLAIRKETKVSTTSGCQHRDVANAVLQVVETRGSAGLSTSMTVVQMEGFILVRNR